MTIYMANGMPASALVEAIEEDVRVTHVEAVPGTDFVEVVLGWELGTRAANQLADDICAIWCDTREELEGRMAAAERSAGFVEGLVDTLMAAPVGPHVPDPEGSPFTMEQAFNTVLAALRHYQTSGQCSEAARSERIDAIATGDWEDEALGSAAIDALCHRLCMGDIILTKNP